MYMHAYAKQWNNETVEHAFNMHVLGHSFLFFLENVKREHEEQEKVICSMHVDVP